MNDNTKYNLEIPFFEDDPRFAHGVECGIIYQRLKTKEIIIDQSIHTVNKDQIELMCVQAESYYKIEKINSERSSLNVSGYKSIN